MTSENFERLKESIIEAGQVMRGERAAARESVHEIQLPREKMNTSFAVCVQTDDPDLLILRKIYEITLYENDLARVIDEAGEAATYPASFFMTISLPEAVESVLAKIA
ncbi:MAG TPA: hypothetical protein VI479_10010 [Blastocatellia bacterium]